ncbi:restriction endonuclease subunit S [Tenacibaculum finnmarkense]|nr:restriction endonuclease subunit S [Tenacibaculum finnmarkense]
MAKTLYDYWFVQFDFPDKNGKPYKSSEGKMIFNEELKREIPVGWEVGILGDIGKISMCKRVLKHETSSDEEIPFFKISTFGKDAKTFISRNLFESYREKYSYPKSGDILISAAGTIGKTVIFDGKLSYFQDSNIVWLANDESKIPNSFLYYYYQKEPWIVTGGSTIKRLYNDNIRNLKICFPPLDVLKHFSKIVNPMLDKQQQIVNENKKLSELRDWLLPMLMNGQVSVGEK